MKTPPTDRAFDESGRIVPVVWPGEAEDPGELAEADARRLRLEMIYRLLDYFIHGTPTPAQIGARLLTLAYLLKCPSLNCGRQKDLAARLGVTEAAVSRAVKILRRNFRNLSDD